MQELDFDTAMMILEMLDPISVTNDTGEYIYANSYWLKLMNLTPESLTGLHSWDLFPDTKVNEVLKTRKAVIAHPITTKEGKGFVSYFPLFQNGEFFGVLSYVLFQGIETALKVSRQVTKLSDELERTKARLKSLSTATYSIGNIIGESKAIMNLRDEIVSAAKTSSTVLVEGETGVGKELVAHSIHDLSSRSTARFVRVNCSAIPEDLAESELFGYEEGAFTGAKKGGKAGKFELAHGGSLFLDEINQLPTVLQPKLLRVIQEREVERIGGKDVIPLNVRLIAATNVSLESMVANGAFRSDLYYRLNVIRIRIPPLRERKDDIPLLARYLVNKLNHQLGLDINHIDADVYDLLPRYDWPGNIRELQNVLESAMNRAEEDVLETRHFRLDRPQLISELVSPKPQPGKSTGSLMTMKADMEYAAIREAMQQCGGNKTEAAKILGISRNALYKKIRKYNDR